MNVHQSLAEWSSWGWPLLVNHLWQATLISLLAFAAAGLLRNGPGRARYAVWLIASAKFALPSVLAIQLVDYFGLSLSSLLASNDGSPAGPAVILQLTAPVATAEASAASQTAQGHNELFCVLTALWLAGAILLIATWLGRRRRFRQVLRATAVNDPPRERLALDRVRSGMKIKRDVRLSILPGRVEPGVWGVWRPRVFLPHSMSEDLSDAELEAVMMHEMIHVARKDNLIANLHRILCCLLWFHPFVWILDRLLLAERERACDEEVIRLGGDASVYASSLLKVLRFCLGWNVAGASNATGSNLTRRVEQIMSKNVQVRFSLWHRVVIGSIAAIVVILSLAAGLLTHEHVVAQSGKPRGGVVGGVPGGAPGGVPGGVPGGIPGGVIGGVTGYVDPVEQQNILERLDQAPEVGIEFRNTAKAPLTITDAKVKAVPREKEGPGDEFAVIPIVTVTNSSGRRIKGVTFEFRSQLERRAYNDRPASPIEPQAAYTSGSQKRLMILIGLPQGWTVRVAGVVFDDGEVWGAVPPPPPPPPPPAELKILEESAERPAQVNNRDGAPLTITSATYKSAKRERFSTGDASNNEERYLVRLSVTVVNNSKRRITGFAFEFGSSEPNDSFRTYASATIEPDASYSLESPARESPGYGFIFVRGNPDQKEFRVIGARFEDGEVWGSFPPAPPPPPRLVAPTIPQAAQSDPTLVRKSGGVLAASAIHRVQPDSPPLAQAARITGSVVVEVTVDEGGAVIAARAISGHPLLKDAAIAAARQWLFQPTTLSGVPVRVIGLLTFNFEP